MVHRVVVGAIEKARQNEQDKKKQEQSVIRIISVPASESNTTAMYKKVGMLRDADRWRSDGLSGLRRPTGYPHATPCLPHTLLQL